MAALKKSWLLPIFSFLIILIFNLAGMSYLHLPSSSEITKIPTTLKPKPTKPWPSSIPSFLPWSSNPNLPPQSCEGFFGNGFTHQIDVLSHTKLGLLPLRNGKLNSILNSRARYGKMNPNLKFRKVNPNLSYVKGTPDLKYRKLNPNFYPDFKTSWNPNLFPNLNPN